MLPLKHLLVTLLVFSVTGTESDPPYANTEKASLNFDIVIKGKVIGSLEATKKMKNGVWHFQSSTIIKTKVIKDIEVHYNYEVSFKDDLLRRAYVSIAINQKPHANTLTHWEGGQYQITINDKEDKVVREPIGYATILLYFKEPVNTTRCYSEQDGTFNTLVPLGDHSYKKINSKGKENTYYYSGGYLKRASIDGGLVNFEMIARE